MTTGCLIFAYDGDVAYGPQAVLAACLVKKHLGIPVCLVTDHKTLDKLPTSSVFEHICINEVEETSNTRILAGKTVKWRNTNRSSAYDVTPFDRTLVIDSDFLVFSNRLKTYLEADRDFMICENMKDLLGRPGAEVQLHPASIHMLWATNIIFNKTPEVKALFDLVDHIKENWKYYGALYKFDTRRFRNDYAFSIACHTIGGYGINQFYTALPSPILITDTDEVVKVSPDTSITYITQDNLIAKTKEQDLHLMNKEAIIKNYKMLMEMSK